jgi:hypothetical protein
MQMLRTTWGRGVFPVPAAAAGVKAQAAEGVRRVRGPEGKGKGVGSGEVDRGGEVLEKRWVSFREVGEGDRMGEKGGERLWTGADSSAQSPHHVGSPLSVAAFPIRPRRQGLCHVRLPVRCPTLRLRSGDAWWMNEACVLGIDVGVHM